MKLLLVYILTLIFMAGCSNDDRTALINDFNATLIQSSPLRINEGLEEIELTVINDVQWDSGIIELRLVNHTEHMISYGESFSIEFFDGESWQRVQFPDDVAFVSIGYGLGPGEASYFTRHLNFLLPNGLIQTGQYRLRMHIFNDADIPIRENDLHDLVAEFYVE